MQGGGGMCRYSHAVVGLYEVAFPHIQFLHTYMVPSQTDILFDDVKVYSEVLKHYSEHLGRKS